MRRGRLGDNPSIEWADTGEALGPRAGVVHHPRCGLSASPASDPQFKRQAPQFHLMSLLKRPYISDFADAVCFAHSRQGNSCDRSAILDDLARTSEVARLSRGVTRSRLRVLAEDYVLACAERGPVEHSCHAISHGFATTLQEHPLGDDSPLAITIGNVSYKGDSLYQVTHERIDTILKHGFDPTKTVDVHVWLTLDDMTVVDLSILSTLAAMGLTSGLPRGAGRVVFWRDDSVSEFEYEPLLVDNDFFSKVERGIVVPGGT